ncbi:Crp/Fnr family transcriptional regulator [Abditibacterium utsteinense]|uniref:Crp/Fnr family transcriptional regulator n=1 Tax=Abditibacterium utsteinense TaxID=1960156 RepID=A0A2S8SVI3_9BACT|nr:Crp/Fnr family transcriptional regulator [Abditibacterium utsteinense]PQV64806.1 Crp/Fnr family transcriptional regulator [Abditibacterium utsteinense]
MSCSNRHFESSSASPCDNAILAALSEAELQFLLPHLKWAEVSEGQVLHELGEIPHPIYFLTRGVVAVSISTETGKSLSLSLIGREGIVGERAIFEGGMPLVRCEMLTDGSAYQMSPQFFNEEFQGGGKLHDLTMRALEARILETSQTALCSQMHTIDQRLSRWLLTFADRWEKDEVPLTHEAISQMLGVRRVGVTTALGILAEAGLIENSRGLISIRNRKELQKQSCECYQVTKNGAERAYQLNRDIGQSRDESR